MTIYDPIIVRQEVRLPQADFEVTVPKDLYYLRGHFPEAPVVPGVVQVHWAISLAKCFLTLNPCFLGIEALKFHRIIEPLTTVHLALRYSEADGKLQFSYSTELGCHSQGRILFAQQR